MRRTTSGTSRLWMLMALLGTARLCFADGDLECSCSIRAQRDAMVNVTCSDVQNGSNDITCLRGERRPASPAAPRYVRDDFLHVSGRSMVLFSSTGNPWQGARRACQLLGADLLTPGDPGKLQLLTQPPFYQMFTDVEAFIGVSDLDQEGRFVDVQGNPVDNITWRAHEPNDAGGHEDCVAWNRRGYANDRTCWEALQYVCEWRLRAAPPAGHRWVGGAGAFLRLSDEALPHDAAAAACAAQGAALFVPDTWARVEALLRHVPVDAGEMLVGVTDRDHEGDFVTDTGRRLSDMEFHEWLPGQPDDGSGVPGSAGEDCVALHSHGFLADVDCQQPRRYVCEWLP